MYILSYEMKRKLGFLIEFYRNERYEETKDKRWQKNNFLTDRNESSICSDKTYNRITRGDVSKNDEIYDRLIAKLGIQYTQPLPVIAQVLNFAEEILPFIEQYNMQGIETVANTCIRVIEPYKHIIYYKEAYELMRLVRDYFIHGMLMSSDQYKKYSSFLDYLQPSTKIIMKHLLIVYHYYAYHDVGKFLELYDAFQIGQENALFHQITHIKAMMLTHRHMEAKVLLDGMIREAKRGSNHHLLAELYALDVSLAWCINRSQACSKWKRLHVLLADQTAAVNQKTKSDCLICVGHIAYDANQMKIAYDLYQDAILHAPANFHLVGLQLKHIEDTLQLPKKNYKQYEGYTTTRRFALLYGYYRQRNTLDLEDLHTMPMISDRKRDCLLRIETIITKHAIDCISPADRIAVMIFMHELHVSARLLGNYTNVQRYYNHFSFGIMGPTSKNERSKSKKACKIEESWA